MNDAAMRTHRLLRVVEHGPGLKSFYFERTFAAQPGQFVNLWLPGVDEKPFSISDLTDTEIELSIKAVGGFTRKLMEVMPGSWMGIRGPFGRGFTPRDRSVLVGGGIGIAPLRYLSRDLEKRGISHKLVLGVRSKGDLVFAEDFEKLDSACTFTSEDGSIGERGLVTGPLQRLIDQGQVGFIQAAGPERMLLAVREIAERHEIPYELSFERYMKCGVGICGQCCMDGSGIRLCVEGPVLTRRELEGVTELGKAHRTASGRRPQ